MDMEQVEVKTSAKLNAPAARIWERVGGWGTIHEWHPAIEATAVESDAVGGHRTITLGDGATIKERLDNMDPGSMTYAYTWIEHPMPLDEYQGTIRVADNGDGTSTMHWSSTFVPRDAPADELRESIAGIYQAGYDALQASLTGD
jgi:mxaD protein